MARMDEKFLLVSILCKPGRIIDLVEIQREQ